MSPTCIIVDDEPLARTILETFCKKIATLNLLGSFSSAVEAFNFVNQNPVDIIFLDIEMPEMNGFDLIKILQYHPKIIVTTAHEKFALKGYDYEITDFILKPYLFDRFVVAVNKCIAALIKEYETAHVNFVSDSSRPMDDYIFIKTNKRFYKLTIADIAFLEGSKDFVKFHLKSKKVYLIYSSLKNLEEKLSSQIFLRVHKSYIVNIKAIDSFFGNTIVANGIEIPIGEQYKNTIKNWFANKTV